MQLSGLFEIPRRHDPDRIALRFVPESGESSALTYRELFDAADGVAAELVRRGLDPGDRVALRLDSCPELAILVLGILRARGIALPLNLAYRRRELEHAFADAGPRWWISDDREGDPELRDLEGEPERLAVSDLLRSGEPPGLGSDADEVAMLLYTSGTTGRSKGAMITHANLAATITALRSAWAWSRDDVLLLTLPLFHTHGLVVGLLTALSAGARVELRQRFRAERVAEELADGAATLFFGVPTMYVRLVAALEAAGEKAAPVGLRLACSGSAPLPAETWERFRQLTGVEILERYGMTEAGMILSNPYAGPRRPGTVGTPLPGVAVRLVDSAGADVEDGEEGEVLVAGGNVFRGYWGLPHATAEAFSTGSDGRRWLRSGDLGRRDPASGAISLLGRRSELILCGGFNVYPREIEELLLEVPGVREAAVAARPDSDLGQVPVAYLVTDSALDPEALDEFCRREMASFKRPRRWVRVESLPRNALGKVQKHRLVEP